jgi:nicotinate-nucleotide--dimethylbenzimidazole phosphoribosyltransferase
MHLPNIPPLDNEAEHAARTRQDTLVKPKGALGELERLSVRIAGMTGRLDWLPMRRAVVVCAGDHGVVAQGVSTVPAAITAYMVRHFLEGTGAISVLARQMGARLMVVDAGVAGDLLDHPQLVRGKIARGTADFTQGSAMTPEQTEQAIQLGLDVTQHEIDKGLDLLVVGEMGIGNTTSASAIIAAITGRDPAQVTGRGTGISDAQLAYKIRVVEQALALHTPASADTLAKVGGFEIGAMAGLMIGAAAQRVPVVIDGLICTSAALIAAQLTPEVTKYLIAGHRSPEPGHQIALDYLGLRPLLNFDMRLGEGTGAALAIPIIEAAMRTLQEMAVLEL